MSVITNLGELTESERPTNYKQLKYVNKNKSMNQNMNQIAKQ